jgi:hypothetical protein
VDGLHWIGIALAALAAIGIAYQVFAFVMLGRFFAAPLPLAGGAGGGPVTAANAPSSPDAPSPSPSCAGKGDFAVTILKPLYGDEGPGSSPDGWDNPYQAGRLTVRSASQAVFEARGVRVALVPSASGEPIRMCD